MKDCQHPDPECYCRRIGLHLRMACRVSNGRVRFSILKLAGLVGDVCERVNSEVHSMRSEFRVGPVIWRRGNAIV